MKDDKNGDKVLFVGKNSKANWAARKVKKKKGLKQMIKRQLSKL